MGRLRQRLDRLEGHAHQTMGSAEELLGFAKDFLHELGDGVDIELHRKPGVEGTFLDFVNGKIDVFPFSIRVVVKE